VKGKVESGSCFVNGQYWMMPNKTIAVVKRIYHGNRERNACSYGQDVQIELGNVEEHISFVLLLIIIF
jgi:hypothetical protein